MLRSIVYISEMVAEFSDDDIDRLTARALIHNKPAGISGILFCFSDRFIQVIEGPGPAVGELYDRIRLDPRHRDVTTVQDVLIEDRAYGDWAMRRIRNQDLGETEKALIFHALRVFDPHTLIGPKVRPVGDASAAFMNRIMARAQPAELPIGGSREVSNLLYAAEIVLARDLVLSEELMEEVAQDAHVSSTLAHTYFPTIADLMRTCVLRIVALEHQAFLSQLIYTRFDSKSELAGFITSFVIKNHDRTAVSHRFADQFSRFGSDFTRQTAWIIAFAALEATPREGWPFPDLDTTTLAAAIGAADGATRILARHDFLSLADPATRMRLFRTCMTALDEPIDDEAFATRQTGAASLSEAATTLLTKK